MLTTLKPRVATLGNRLPTMRPGSWRTDKQGSTARGYGYKWQQAREGWLRKHPLCQCPDCDDGRKRVTLASVVDHITPHRGNQALFWDSSNWQSMSKQCHDIKTAQETGATCKAVTGLDGWPL